ncbi:MAG TPA: FKBP-type peptidyl-prolyl cis-trans isomerase [Solirubrobacterales bacterium]|nr:FKBP-type peptidyl-prolyl cis-trans isomerase [Solirubrobacterales bacterium]
MKFLVAGIALCLALAASGCGGDDAATSQSRDTVPLRIAGGEFEQEGPFAAISIGGKGTRPKLDPPDRPPPKTILIRDLEVGDGPVARRGDLVVVYYVGVDYKTGKEQYGHWPPDDATEAQLTFDTESKAWEESIEGMRAGGLREMIIPSRLLFGTGTIDYVLELTRVEPAGR